MSFLQPPKRLSPPVSCSMASTHRPAPSPTASAVCRMSFQSPAAAMRVHLPVRAPRHRAASPHVIPAATASVPAASLPLDRASNMPRRSVAAGKRPQFPSRPLPFPKPNSSKTAGSPNQEMDTQIPAAHESPLAPPSRLLGMPVFPSRAVGRQLFFTVCC